VVSINDDDDYGLNVAPGESQQQGSQQQQQGSLSGETGTEERVLVMLLVR